MSKNEEKKALYKQAIHLIDNWLDYQVYIKEIPGIAVGVFLEDEIIFQKEYGYANIEEKKKLTDKHLFRIASHSKLFTATAIMKLYSEDKLSIDDKISKFLPWFTSDKDHNLDQVRIRHLLTHSSGMTRDGITAHWSTYKFPDLEEIKKQVQDGISFFETSEILKYSNFGYTILGQIIEKVSGLSYHDFIKQEILGPLDMNNTVTEVTNENITKHATGYKIKFPRKEREPFEHVKAEVMHSATGLSSNVEDLIKFYQAHFLGNDKLFPDYIKREMQRVQFKSKLTDWGLGFSIANLADTKLIGHGGGYPGFITRSGLIQEEKMILVVLTNAVDGPAFILLQSLYKLFKKLEKEKDKFTLEKDEEILDMKEIVGFYQSDWGISLFSQLGKNLVIIAPGADTPADFLRFYDHIEDYKFKAPNEPYNASPGETIEFIEGLDGEKIFVDSHKGQAFKFQYSY